MEPVFLDMAQMENYQHESFATYGDQMQYIYDSPQYSTAQPYAQPGYDYYQYQNVADPLVYSKASGHDAFVLLATDQQSNGIKFEGDPNTSVMAFKTEAEMLDYLSSFGDLNNIQFLPIVGDIENTENCIDHKADQQVPAEIVETPSIDCKELASVLPDQLEQPVQRTISTKTTALKATTKRRRARLVYEKSSFVCEPCGRTFGRRSSLRQHNNVHHSGPREHRCEECGKRFHTVEDLRRHVERHEAQHKPHKCAECPRQFNYQQDLDRHIAVRHGVAKYACQHCGKRTARRDHLLSHEATHTRRLNVEQRRNRFLELGQQQQQ